MSKNNSTYGWIIISIMFCAIMFLYLSGCTYSVNLVHTEGNAEDVIDEDQSPTTDLDANLSLPLVS